MTTLKVISYNIHKGKTASGLRPSIDRLAGSLPGLSADLVFLQEVQGENSRVADLHAQHDNLARTLRCNVAYGKNAVRRHSSHGNALLSRLPILHHENQNVSDHRLEQRGLLHVQLCMEGTTLHCFVVHLGLFHRSRLRQVEAIVKRIERTLEPHEPVIIAGDFNDWNRNLEHLFLEELDLQPVFDCPPKTYPAMLPMFCLDRMYQRGFEVLDRQVLKGQPWIRISDHAPLLAELRLRPA